MTDPHNTPDPADRRKTGGGYWQSRVRGLLQVGAGNMFASSVIAGLVIGFGLDAWLDTAPIFMLVVGALGFVGGMRNARRSLLAMGRDDEPRDSDRP
ncbi:MAG: AtpZ/AtpI family protein [Halothiobacillaceae bacterium]|nr:AtpZ/AtpI family protein [Halothiobacillaceae bacterium]